MTKRIGKITSRSANVALAMAMALFVNLQARPAAAAEKCKITSLEIPVTVKGGRAIATVGINGTQVPLTVDSGAFTSFLTPAAARQLKLDVGALHGGMRITGLTGEVDAGLTSVKEMELVGGKLPNMAFIVGGNEPGAGTMGLLGRNVLAVTDTEYDLAHGVIRLMFPKGDCSQMGMAYWADGKPVSELQLQVQRDDSRSKLPPMQATVELNGKKLKAMFDTGAISLVSLSAAKDVGLTEAMMKPAGVSAGGGLGYAKTWIAPFDSFVIGGEKTKNLRILVVDYDKDNVKEEMLLGIDFFLSHRIYVSKSRHRMFFTYNGGRVFGLSEVAEAAEGAASAPELASADAYVRRAAGAAAREDYRAALADLDRALQMQPGNAAVLVQRGEVHESLRQGTRALADYEAALKLEPQQPDALLHRARYRESQHDRNGALQDIEALDRLLPAQAYQRLQLARLYQKMDLQDRSIPQLDQWIAARDQDIEMASALNNRCWTRMLLNTGLDQALKDCDKALDFEPDNASFRDSRAWVRLRRGEPDKALPDFDRALKIKDDLPWARYGRGLVLSRLGKPDAGNADLEAARQLLPAIDEQTKRWALNVAAQKCSVQSMQIPVAIKDGRVIATVTINDIPVPLIVDSGTSFSVLTPASARKLRLSIGSLPPDLKVEGLTGKADVGMTRVREVELADGTLTNKDFIVGGNEPGLGAMGILGRNILAAADTEYDLAHGVIRLMFPKGDCGDMGMAYWAGDKPVSELPLLRGDAGNTMPPAQATIELNGKKVSASFDTGANSRVSLSAAKRLGLTETAMTPAGGTKNWTARFDGVVIGGEQLKNPRIAVVDDDQMKGDMLLGIDFFLSHRIYISKSQRTLYFTYNGGRVFAPSEAAGPG